jgi:hypothetical protein
LKETAVADPKSFDDIAFQIPEDADPAVKHHMRAQMAIQAAFYAFGEAEQGKGEYSLDTSELLEVLTTSIAMLLSADEGLRTRGGLRRIADVLAKQIRTQAEALQGDHAVPQMLSLLGLMRSKPN